VTLLGSFFLVGASMCALTIGLLLKPESSLTVLWRVNPRARDAFTQMGPWAHVLMIAVGLACAAAAAGRLRGASWGRWLAVIVLSINLVVDVTTVFLRHELRTLIGVPIAGLFIFYLLGSRARSFFLQHDRPGA
jgi:hypothetical protein